MLTINDIIIDSIYTKHNGELLGFIPCTYDGIWYYCCKAKDLNGNDIHVAPVYGGAIVNHNDHEDFYLRDFPENYKGRAERKLDHEVHSAYHRERASTHTYKVFFLGCDDGDTMMRFKSREHALEVLTNVVDFSELFNSVDMFMIH